MLTQNGQAADGCDADLRVLGDALSARAEDVVERLQVRTRQAAGTLDPAIEETFLQVARVSTRAVAEWMSGGDEHVARTIGSEAAHSFGKLAAQRAAALNEATKQCLRWRDSATEVVVEEGERLGVADETLAAGIGMLRRSMDVTLVRMCEQFEDERQRMHEELTSWQAQLVFQATHDALTGLPNRSLILDRVRQALVRARRSQTPIAVIFIDLDNFKNVNDTFGHNVGDELLRAAASRLAGIVRETDTLGRLGGDEFVVVAEGISLLAGPELIAERLLEVLRSPFSPEGCGTSLMLTASLGIAAGTRPSADALLRDADIAMYRAKWAGRDRYALFEPEMGAAAQSRLELEMDLRVAIEEEQFSLVYQPIFDLEGMRTTSIEALLRWQHPTRGLVLPDEFVPLLEETGMITTVGRWVLDHACRMGAELHAAGHDISVAVNVSARQLDTDAFVDDVHDLLAESGFPPESLVVEITETGLMRNPEATARRLHAIKALGVSIAIDDFGTGYSSLDHLRQFPIDSLKIDQSFTNRMLQDPEGVTLIRTLVQLGQALSITTLAEGIEDPHQLAQLREASCDSGQGFLFARPLDAQSVSDFLDTEALPRHASTRRARELSSHPVG